MPSRITVAVCVPMAGVRGCTYGGSRGLWETFARRNWVPCDVWYSVLRLNFHLEGAAIVVFPRTGTIVLYMVYCKGF